MASRLELHEELCEVLGSRNAYFQTPENVKMEYKPTGAIRYKLGGKNLKRANNKIYLSIYGFLAGISFSLLMDIWSTLWMYGSFNLSRYLASVTTALPYTALYAVSNVIFLLLLTKPIGKKLERIKTKYGI